MPKIAEQIGEIRFEEYSRRISLTIGKSRNWVKKAKRSCFEDSAELNVDLKAAKKTRRNGQSSHNDTVQRRLDFIKKEIKSIDEHSRFKGFCQNGIVLVARID